MMGREDLDECPKCHNIGLQFERVHGPTAMTTTAKWCDCPLAKRHIAGLRSQTYPKARIALLMRNFMERMAQKQPEDAEQPEEVAGGYNTVTGLFGSWDTEENREQLARLYQQEQENVHR